MERLDWNDLRTFAEVARRGSMAAAARALGVHPTTIARRVAAAEEALGAPLFLRAGKALSPAPAGAKVLAALDPLVDAVDDVARRAARRDDLPIRIAVTENGARVLAARAVPALLREAPIDVELLAGNAVLDLARGDADLAVRLVEPTSPELVRRRLGVTHYGLFASAGYLARAPALAEGLEGQTIVAPGGELSRSPEGRFLAEHGRRARVALRCSSLVALAAAAEAGVGLVALPTNLALFHPALRLVRALDEIPVRAVWLVMHRDAAKDARVRRAAKVVGQVVTAALEESAPAAIAGCPARPRTARRARSS